MAQSRTLEKAWRSVPKPHSALRIVTEQFGQTKYRQVPLNEQLSDTPQPVTANYTPAKTEISKLSNGVTVASRQTYDAIANVGFLVKAGSRFLDSGISGMGHYLETNTFKETSNRHTLDILRTLNGMGAQYQVQAFRDCILYQVELFPEDSGVALEILADVTQNPTLQHTLVHDSHAPYLWSRGDILEDPMAEVPELMHQAAYSGSSLGLPFFADDQTIDNINSHTIREFYETWYTPDRLVVTGTGLDHGSLVAQAEASFGHLKAATPIATDKAQYAGGELRVKNKLDGNQHIALIFEGEDWNSPDLMAFCTLNMMMGGGGSFSAGGPGKGMYTRLYQEVLGMYPWAQHVSCSHSIFDDSGIFCLYGITNPQHATLMTETLVDQALKMASRKPSPEELSRAKNTLSSNIAFEFEHRQILFEDIARQTCVYGEHREPAFWKAMVEKVTAEDVQRVAAKMMKSKPTLLNVGSDFSNAPNFDHVRSRFG